MKSLNELFKPKDVIGCDVGTSSLKFVRLKDNKGIISLQSIGMLEADVLSDNTVPLQRARAFVHEHGFSGHASMNVEDSTLRIRRMDLPEMPRADLKIAIKWNFREYVDGPIEKFAVDYSDFGEMKDEGDKNPILAFAVSNDAVEKLMKVAKFIGVKPVSIEPNATALLAALDLNIGWESGKYYAMIDLGLKITNFIVVGNGHLLFSRPLSNAAFENLLKGISRDCGVQVEQAPAFFKSFLNKEPVSDEVSAKVQRLISAFLSQMVVEVQRSVDAFCLMFHVDKVDSLFLSGGGSLISGMSEYLTKNLGISTRLFNPFEHIELGAFKGKIVNPQLYAVAVGLAIPRA